MCRFPASATGETDNAMSPGLRRRIIVIGSLLSVLWAFFVGVGGYSEQFGGSRIFLAVAVQLGGVVFWMALTRSLYGRRRRTRRYLIGAGFSLLVALAFAVEALRLLV